MAKENLLQLVLKKMHLLAHVCEEVVGLKAYRFVAVIVRKPLRGPIQQEDRVSKLLKSVFSNSFEQRILTLTIYKLSLLFCL